MLISPRRTSSFSPRRGVWKRRDRMSPWFWSRVSSLLSQPAPQARSRGNSLARAAGWRGRSLVVLFGTRCSRRQPRVAGRRLVKSERPNSRRAGEPSRRTGRHRLCGLHRPDRRRPVGQYRRPGHRLPGADALQGRIGSQSRGPVVRDRSAPVPSAARPGQEPGQAQRGATRPGEDHFGALPGPRQDDARRRQQTGAGPVQGGGRRSRGPRGRPKEEPGSLQAEQSSRRSCRRSTARSAATT